MGATGEQMLHECSVKERRHMQITGVLQVISFDEESVILQSKCGEMSIEGKGLLISVLDTEHGRVVLDGESIDALYYSDPPSGEKKGFFGKLMR